MGIGSISSATFDSVISYFQSDPTPDKSINRVIFHLGTNDINTDTTETLTDKLDRLAQETQTKFPNANVAFCKIPPQVNTPEDIGEKISEINEKIKSLDADFIDV